MNVVAGHTMGGPLTLIHHTHELTSQVLLFYILIPLPAYVNAELSYVHKVVKYLP